MNKHTKSIDLSHNLSRTVRDKLTEALGLLNYSNSNSDSSVNVATAAAIIIQAAVDGNNFTPLPSTVQSLINQNSVLARHINSNQLIVDTTNTYNMNGANESDTDMMHVRLKTDVETFNPNNPTLLTESYVTAHSILKSSPSQIQHGETILGNFNGTFTNSPNCGLNISNSNGANNFQAALALASRFHPTLVDSSTSHQHNGINHSFAVQNADSSSDDMCFSNQTNSDSAPIMYLDENRLSLTNPQCLLINGISVSPSSLCSSAQIPLSSTFSIQRPNSTQSTYGQNAYATNRINDSPNNSLILSGEEHSTRSNSLETKNLLSQITTTVSSNVTHTDDLVSSHSADSNFQMNGEETESMRNLNSQLNSMTNSNASTTINSKKREQRLIKNREAARECRRKKKEYVRCLENRVTILENQNQQLIAELKRIKAYACNLTLNAGQDNSSQIPVCSRLMFSDENIANGGVNEINGQPTLAERNTINVHEQRAQLMNEIRSLMTPLDNISTGTRSQNHINSQF